MTSFFDPHLSPSAQTLFRALYGLLLLLFLLQTIPVSRWFFVSERWRGYAKSGPLVDVLQNPVSLWMVMSVWIGCAVSLMTGFWTFPAALLNLILCRYFFVHMRWKGILRGGGAPGFMSYWLAAVAFILELTSRYDPAQTIRPVALLAVKTDYALIMLSAGLYKVLSGYAKNEGMELGMVNPWWGYWWKLYKGMNPSGAVFRALNHNAYMTEIVAAALMLFPPTQLWGAGLISLSFLFICTQIRLGFLTEMVMICGLLFIEAGGSADRWISSLPFLPAGALPVPAALPGWLAQVLTGFFWAYFLLLLPAHAGLYYNFLARRRLPRPIQAALERYTNFFGIIIWRVFTIDVINFFVRIRIRDGSQAEFREYTRFDVPDPASRFRYWHVSEFVCFASIFTTLKYYPDNAALFQERLVRYARTLPCADGGAVVFDYYAVRKSAAGFAFVRVAEFEVDPASGSLSERTLDPSVNVRAAHQASPVHAGAVPGSYAPAREPSKTPPAV